MSNANKLTNTVICNMKLIIIDTDAYKAKVFTAGIDDNAPIKKHKHSEVLVSNIDGPTDDNIRPI